MRYTDNTHFEKDKLRGCTGFDAARRAQWASRTDEVCEVEPRKRSRLCAGKDEQVSERSRSIPVITIYGDAPVLTLCLVYPDCESESCSRLSTGKLN